MKNCFITKLKASVEGTLPKIGELSFALKANSVESQAFSFRVSNQKEFKLKIQGNGNFYSSETKETLIGKEVTIPANSMQYAYIGNTQEGDILSITEKYTLVRLQIITANVLVAGSVLDTSFLNKIDRFDTFSSLCVVDEDKLTKYAKDITAIYTIDNPNAIGSIETMAENLLSLGRNSGTLTVNAYYSQVTFNGVKFFTDAADRTQAMTITFGSNSATCAWKGNTVATYDGSTWTYSN